MPRRKAQPKSKKRAAPKLPVTKPAHFRFHRKTTPVEKIADVLTSFFGTLSFLILNVLCFLAWILWNLELHPNTVAFDPYPFGMLTMMVSLEAIVLSVVVLISQNRATKMADARSEIDFEVDVAGEQQTAAIMQTLDLIVHHLEITHIDDVEGRQAVNLEKMERRILNEIDTD